MSFTAQVKDELSRVEPPHPQAEKAQLSALVRVCGTLSFRGYGRYAIHIATETGAVARTILRFCHELYDVRTQTTPRRSILHKTRNYLIEMPEQDGLEDDLIDLGILERGRGLCSGLPKHLLQSLEARLAFVRGAFMAGGFVSDPRGDFHLEIQVSGERFAEELSELMHELGVSARLNHRRGAYVLYLKSYRDISSFLAKIGARTMARVVRAARAQKSVKNDVNRRVNAELANQARSTSAAADQLQLIDEIDVLLGIQQLPPALANFCKARREHPELSLASLGAELNPPASKSAMYHRLLRLEKTLKQLQESNKDSGRDCDA